MIVAYVGKTLTLPFTCTRTENGVERPYNPTVVKVSLLHADGTEETLVYGGTDPGDGHVVLLATGSFEAKYIPLVAEELIARVQTGDTVLGTSWPSLSDPIRIDVQPVPQRFTDRPAV